MNERALRELTERLRAAHGDALVSVLAYGRPGGSSEILVVLERIGPSDLRAAHDAVEVWVKADNPPPLYFTAAEIADASDVFPVEFLDMAENRRVLAGRDPLDGLDVSRRNLRHQVEYELRGKLVRLRRFYIPASESPERLTRLLVQSLNTFARLFRHALDLAGASGASGAFGAFAPGSPREIVGAGVARFGLDPAPFDEIFAAEASGKPLDEARAHACFGAYMEQIERVVDAVDKLPEA
jgi:hypothetical protein